MEDETACVKRGKKPDCLAHLASVYNKVRNALLHLFFIYFLHAKWWNLQILCKTTCRVTWVTWITNTEEWISVNFFLTLHGYTKIIVKLLENFQFWKKILKTWKKYLLVVSWYYGIRKTRILHIAPSRLCITQRNETTALLLLETFSSARWKLCFSVKIFKRRRTDITRNKGVDVTMVWAKRIYHSLNDINYRQLLRSFFMTMSTFWRSQLPPHIALSQPDMT